MTGKLNGKVAEAVGICVVPVNLEPGPAATVKDGTVLLLEHYHERMTPAQREAVERLRRSDLLRAEDRIAFAEMMDAPLLPSHRRVVETALRLAQYGNPTAERRIPAYLAAQITLKAAAKEAAAIVERNALAAIARIENERRGAKTPDESRRLLFALQNAKEEYTVAREALDRATVALNNVHREIDAQHLAAALAESATK